MFSVKPAGVGQVEDHRDGGGCCLGQDQGVDVVASEHGVGRLEDEAVDLRHRGATVVGDGEVVEIAGLLRKPL